MTKYSLSTYQDIALQLSELDQWLSRYHIQVGPTRIGHYRRRIDALITAYTAGTIPNAFSREEVSSFILTFQEIQELEYVRQHLSYAPDIGLAGKLRDIVGGPVLTSGEVSPGTANHARNILFELTIAATLAAAGFPLLPSGICDLCTSFEGQKVMIECKRPQSQKKVERLVKEGMRQIGKHLGGQADRSFGLLALSASKVISGGTHVIRTPNKEGIRTELVAAMDQIIQAHGLAWNRNVPCGMVAVILHAGATGIAEDSGQLYTGKQFAICPIERQPEERVELARRFYNRFASASLAKP